MQGELQDESAMTPSAGAKRRPMRGRTMLIVGAAAVGAAIGGAGIASAASGGSTSPTSAAPTTAGAQPGDPATLSHGPGEKLLTGTTADKVKAAALAADPGATIVRVETDSAGSPYEAHIKKADGSEVTLKIDASFEVTSTDQGFGGGPRGQAPPYGQAPPSSGAPSA